MLPTSLGGVRGMIGLLLVAVGVGIAYGSLVATILSQWLPIAGTLLGVVLFGTVASVLVLVWLMSSVLR